MSVVTFHLEKRRHTVTAGNLLLVPYVKNFFSRIYGGQRNVVKLKWVLGSPLVHMKVTDLLALVKLSVQLCKWKN